MGVLDVLTSLLRDSEWHDLNEISTEVRNVSMTSLMDLVNLLVDYGFAEKRETPKGEFALPVVEAKLTDTYLNFLKRIDEIEKTEH